MEFHQINGVVSDLVPVRERQSGAFELYDRDDSFTQQDAIQSETPTAKVILQDDVLIVREVARGQRVFQQLNHVGFFVEMLL